MLVYCYSGLTYLDSNSPTKLLHKWRYLFPLALRILFRSRHSPLQLRFILIVVLASHVVNAIPHLLLSVLRRKLLIPRPPHQFR